MLFLVVLAVGLLTVRPAGGRFQVLSEVPLRAPWLVALALALQVVTISVLTNPPHLLAAGLHVLSYAVAALFLWCNRRLAGLPVLTAGAALNLTAIVANAGVMPAREAALSSAGIVADPSHFANSATLDDARLAFLGDVFAVPEAAGLLANVFSVGDVLLAVGAVWLLHGAAGCRWTHLLPARAALAVD